MPPLRAPEKPKEVVYTPKTPNPGQAQFAVNTTREDANIHLFIGGGGAGKTCGMVQVANEVLWIPGNAIAIVRKTRKDVMATSYHEFKANMPAHFIVHEDKTLASIWIRTSDPECPSRVDFRGMDDADDWGSTQYGQIFLDEANQFSFREFLTFRQRLRAKLPPGALDQIDTPYRVWRPTKQAAERERATGIPVDPSDRSQWEWRMLRFIVGVCNPIPNPDHWLRRLYSSGTVGPKPFSVTVVRVSTDDNAQNLDDEYLAILEDQPEAERRRMKGGEDTPGVTGEPCTPHFIDKPVEAGGHVFERAYPQHPIVLVEGYDFGYGHPSWHALEIVDGIAYVWDEHLGENLTLDELVTRFVAPKEGRFPSVERIVCWVDHQAADQHTDKARATSRAVLKGHGYRMKSRYSRPSERADLVDDLLRAGKLFVHRRCTNTRLALSGYWHRDEEGEPEKDGYFDNIGDSLGIPLMCEFGRFAGTRRPVKDTGEPVALHGNPRRRRHAPQGRFALPGMRRVG